jgi:hypothetical protein
MFGTAKYPRITEVIGSLKYKKLQGFKHQLKYIGIRSCTMKLALVIAYSAGTASRIKEVYFHGYCASVCVQ